jgi:hypothetical protein
MFANINGKQFEDKCFNILEELDIKILKQYTTIFNRKGRLDYYLPELDIGIECKYQQVGGSVIEKLPYTLLNLNSLPFYKTILVFGGKYLETHHDFILWAKINTPKVLLSTTDTLLRNIHEKCL